MSDEMKRRDDPVDLLAAFALSPLLVLAEGFVLAKMWGWFASGLTGVQIGYGRMSGLVLFAVSVKMMVVGAKEPKPGASHLKKLFEELFASMCLLLFAYIVKIIGGL